MVVKDPPDDHTVDRVAALKSALAEAKVPLRATVRVSGYPEEAGGLIAAELKADPKIGIVLSEEDRGADAIGVTFERLGLTIPPASGGYVSDQKYVLQVKAGETAAVGNRKLQSLAIRAVRAAVAAIEGKPLPELVVAPVAVRAEDPIAASRQAIQNRQSQDPGKP
jgi:hypothetical protein